MAKPAVKGSTAVEMVEYAKDADISSVEKMDNESGSIPHDEKNFNAPPTTARDLVTEILLVEDDPSEV